MSSSMYSGIYSGRISFGKDTGYTIAVKIQKYINDPRVKIDLKSVLLFLKYPVSSRNYYSMAIRAILREQHSMSEEQIENIIKVAKIKHL